jgi:hypothetical protein
MELFETKEKIKSGVIYEKKPNLGEVAYEIFEKEEFSEGDIVLIDNDETLTPTWKNFLLGESFDVLPEDSRIFLETCDEKNIKKAIVTNMPRAGHYLNHTNSVFGYDHYFDKGILRSVEFPLTLCLGSLYKQTEKSLYEIAAWSMHKMSEEGRIVWIGNSYLDKGFGFRLEKILREMGFENEFHMYMLPWIRSFRT